MAVKKRQHYVPQFYLRNFSLRVSEKLISLLHIPSDRYVPKAGIKEQAYEDYFYGRVEIEDALGDVEKVASRVINSAVATDELPPRLSEGHHALLVFTLFQGFRTRAAADEADDEADKLVRAVAGQVPHLKDHLDEVEFSLTNAPAFSLGAAAWCYPVAIDLRYKLLCNRTPVPFITSDHPVVFYNQFLHSRKSFGSNTGLAAKGLQIFLPLSPRHVLVFFDVDVYKVGGGSPPRSRSRSRRNRTSTRSTCSRPRTRTSTSTSATTSERGRSASSPRRRPSTDPMGGCNSTPTPPAGRLVKRPAVYSTCTGPTFGPTCRWTASASARTPNGTSSGTGSSTYATPSCAGSTGSSRGRSRRRSIP